MMWPLIAARPVVEESNGDVATGAPIPPALDVVLVEQRQGLSVLIPSSIAVGSNNRRMWPSIPPFIEKDPGLDISSEVNGVLCEQRELERLQNDSKPPIHFERYPPPPTLPPSHVFFFSSSDKPLLRQPPPPPPPPRGGSFICLVNFQIA